MKTLKPFGLLAIVLILIVYMTIYYNTQEVVNITVTGKERVITGSGDSMSSKYLVFTETETFKNTDSMIFGKWNSSDLYSKLREDQQYKATVAGWRIPFLSMYRNIIKLQ